MSHESVSYRKLVSFAANSDGLSLQTRYLVNVVNDVSRLPKNAKIYKIFKENDILSYIHTYCLKFDFSNRNSQEIINMRLLMKSYCVDHFYNLCRLNMWYNDTLQLFDILFNFLNIWYLEGLLDLFLKMYAKWIHYNNNKEYDYFHFEIVSWKIQLDYWLFSKTEMKSRHTCALRSQLLLREL